MVLIQMCGKVISGADYEQINSFGDFSNGQQIFHHEPNCRNTKGRGTNAAAVFAARTDFERTSERFRTNLLTARRPNGFRTIRSDRFGLSSGLFRAPSGGVSDCHSEGIPPHRPDKSPDRFPEEFQVVIPDQISGPRTDSGPPSVRTTTPDAPPPRKSHRKAGGIPNGATCGRNRLTQTSGSAAPPTCIRLSAPAPRRTRAKMMKSRLLVRKRLTGLGPVVDHAALAGAVGQPVAGRAFGDIAFFPASNSGRAGARIPDNATCCSA